MDLANRLYRLDGKPRHVVGIGLDTSIEGDARRFRSTYGIDGPFILYAGRQDKGKNTPLLVRYFHRFLQSYKGDLKLVLMGSGGVPIPDTIQGSVRSLGFVPVQDKIDAYKAATVFCQPSVNESFSLVIMESWLQETPVLVHGDCPVTKGHCLRSNGGLYFSNYPEFEETLSLLLRDDSLRTRMGRAGRTYVLENYRWDVVVERYKKAVRGIFGEA
jgi:glycosyltransferase involved in cell wall biosynthesis